MLSARLRGVLVALAERVSSRKRRRREREATTRVHPIEPESSEVGDQPARILTAESLAPGSAVTARSLDPPGLEEPDPQPQAPPAADPAPREWNLWDLERQARDHAGDAARDEEWTALFVYLRPFANTAGLLPTEFDGLVRESFAELIQAA